MMQINGLKKESIEFFQTLNNILGEYPGNYFEIIEGNINSLRSYFSDFYSANTKILKIWIEDGYVIGISMHALLDHLSDEMPFSLISRSLKNKPGFFSPLTHLIFLDILGVRILDLDLSKNHFLTFIQPYYDGIKISLNKSQSEYFSKAIENFSSIIRIIDLPDNEIKKIPEFLKIHLEVIKFESDYEWDSFDIDVARKMIESENCDLGTALHIYWYFRPYEYHSVEMAEKIKNKAGYHWDHKVLSLLNKIEDKVEGGLLKTAVMPFDIQYDQPSWDCYKAITDLVKEIPQKMFQTVKSNYLSYL